MGDVSAGRIVEGERIPHVPSPGDSKQPRARNANGQWRRKRVDVGKRKGSGRQKGILGWLGF
jgi:hypothetical protein